MIRINCLAVTEIFFMCAQALHQHIGSKAKQNTGSDKVRGVPREQPAQETTRGHRQICTGKADECNKYIGEKRDFYVAGTVIEPDDKAVAGGR